MRPPIAVKPFRFVAPCKIECAAPPAPQVRGTAPSPPATVPSCLRAYVLGRRTSPRLPIEPQPPNPYDSYRISSGVEFCGYPNGRNTGFGRWYSWLGSGRRGLFSRAIWLSRRICRISFWKRFLLAAACRGGFLESKVGSGGGYRLGRGAPKRRSAWGFDSRDWRGGSTDQGERGRFDLRICRRSRAAVKLVNERLDGSDDDDVLDKMSLERAAHGTGQ